MNLSHLVTAAAPATEPRLHYLLGGFVLLVAGLAGLTRRRPAGSIADGPGQTRRALAFCVVYAASVTCFARLLAPALLGPERSPWLLALGDVLFVTCGLFVWVLTLAERRSWAEYGIRGGPAGRILLALLFGVAAAAFFGAGNYLTIAQGGVAITADTLVFALLFAAVGSALPEELLFRGYLQGSLDSRNRWVRIGLPALAFTVLRGLRFLPGRDMSPGRWLLYELGVVFPLGLWWGLMRDLARGSLWPTLASNFLIEFGRTLAGAPPVLSTPELH